MISCLRICLTAMGYRILYKSSSIIMHIQLQLHLRWKLSMTDPGFAMGVQFISYMKLNTWKSFSMMY